MEYVLYITAAALICLIILLSAPLWLGRMLLPGLTFALMRRFGWLAQKVAALIKPDLDIKILVNATNRYYARRYQDTPYRERAVFLPFCLKPPNCPAAVNKHEGLLCQSQCEGCALGRLRQEAINLGYGWVYVVPSSTILKNQDIMPSSQFIKTKITEHAPSAALGVICAWHLRNRLLPSHKKVGRQGYVTQEGKDGTALHGVLLKGRNCKQAMVDWEDLRTALILK